MQYPDFRSVLLSFILLQGYACSLSSAMPSLWPYTREVYPWISLVLSTLLPFAGILICNGGIIYGLIRAKRMRAQTTSMTSGGPQLNSILATLFAVSFSFILLSLPYPVALLLQGVNYGNPSSPTYITAVFMLAVAPIFASVNHSLNILMYCLCGKKFRATLLSLLCAPFHCLRGANK